MSKPKSKKPVTNAAVWKKTRAEFELEVPSGHVALVRRPGMEAFIKGGLIPNNLMPIVEQAMKGEVTDVKEVMAHVTMEDLESITGLYDRVVLYCVISPELHPEPAEGEDRDPEKLYVDEIEMDDKMFIFQWAVGGTSDVEQFRKEQAVAVSSVPAGEAVPVSPELAVADQQ